MADSTAGTSSPPPAGRPPEPSAGTSPTSESSGSTWRTLLPALTFLVGAALATAVLLVGRSGDVGEVPTGADPSGSATATAAPQAQATGSELLVRVPAACVEAAEFAEVVTGSLGDLADAASDFDARRLQETLDRLQNVRPDVEAAARTCRDLAAQGTVETAAPVTPAPTPPPAPAAAPSASAAA